jgi:hypothetical protein
MIDIAKIDRRLGLPGRQQRAPRASSSGGFAMSGMLRGKDDASERDTPEWPESSESKLSHESSVVKNRHKPSTYEACPKTVLYEAGETRENGG